MARVIDREAARERAQAEAGELHARLVGEVERLASSDDWKAALDTMTRFHDYSFGNLLLIVSQCPDATRVAGYRTWQGMGRQVRKGERGIRIFAPMGGPCRSCDGGKKGGLTCGSCGGSGRWTAFRAVSVFDLAQTDGDPLPEVLAPELLRGEGPIGMLAAVVGLIRAEGFEVLFVDGAADLGGANGRCWHERKLIEIRGDMDTAQQVKTAVHELAHARMHGGALDSTSRGRKEVEAESVAYVVCSWAGLDTSGYTLPYVGGWSGGKSETVRETGQRVQKCAAAIIAALDTESTLAAGDTAQAVAA